VGLNTPLADSPLFPRMKAIRFLFLFLFPPSRGSRGADVRFILFYARAITFPCGINSALVCVHVCFVFSALCALISFLSLSAGKSILSNSTRPASIRPVRISPRAAGGEKKYKIKTASSERKVPFRGQVSQASL
jgi:hypothetical protein